MDAYNFIVRMRQEGFSVREVNGQLGISPASRLEREVKELRRANDILKLASAIFAQAELARHRDTFGVEPICRILQIAPLCYHRYAARQCHP